MNRAGCSCCEIHHTSNCPPQLVSLMERSKKTALLHGFYSRARPLGLWILQSDLDFPWFSLGFKNNDIESTVKPPTITSSSSLSLRFSQIDFYNRQGYKVLLQRAIFFSSPAPFLPPPLISSEMNQVKILLKTVLTVGVSFNFVNDFSLLIQTE